jgi:alkylated DNA nucleotide flippase Atl1
MTTELDALPESVKEALDEIAHNVGTEDEARIVRAALLRYRAMVSDRSREMLRLVHESGELKTRAEKAEARVQELERENGLLVRGHKVALSAWRDAEAELAAVKKRIAEAETFVVHRHPAGAVMATYMCNSKLDGKRVALLPLDDEEPKQ